LVLIYEFDKLEVITNRTIPAIPTPEFFRNNIDEIVVYNKETAKNYIETLYDTHVPNSEDDEADDSGDESENFDDESYDDEDTIDEISNAVEKSLLVNEIEAVAEPTFDPSTHA
jgi:hypothetical protein